MKRLDIIPTIQTVGLYKENIVYEVCLKIKKEEKATDSLSESQEKKLKERHKIIFFVDS